MATKQIELIEDSSIAYISIAATTLEIIGWKVDFFNESSLRASINTSEYRPNYKTFSINIKNGIIILKCSGDIIIKDGSNEKQLHKFLMSYAQTKLTANEEIKKNLNEIKRIERRMNDAKLYLEMPILNTYKIDSLKNFFHIFLLPKKIWVTSAIINTSILAYLFMVFISGEFLDFDRHALQIAGALNTKDMLQGQYWRLFTGIFLHSNFPHILLNMIFLFSLGSILEPLLGKFKFFMTYILIGVSANLASYFWYDDLFTVGASGAIFGLMGIVIAMAITNKIPSELRKFIIIIVLLIILDTTIRGFLRGSTNHVAHFAGLFTGMLLTFLFNFYKKAKFLAQN